MCLLSNKLPLFNDLIFSESARDTVEKDKGFALGHSFHFSKMREGVLKCLSLPISVNTEHSTIKKLLAMLMFHRFPQMSFSSKT